MSWEQFKRQFLWKRRMTPEEVKALANEIFGNVLNGKEYDNNYPYARLSNFIRFVLQQSPNYKTFKGFFQAQLKDNQLITQAIYYKPINVGEADKDKFKGNIDIPIDKNTKKSDEFISSVEPNNSELFAVISNLDEKEPSVEEPNEEPQPNADVPKPDEKKKKTSSAKKSNPEKPKLTKDQKDIMKAQRIAEMFKGPSWQERNERLITAIAKDKSLMSLPKEQFQDYLKEKLKFDDKNLDAVTEAVVAKRAELLDKNQLKREQLTDVDFEKLQEQSQRDFERKLHDQNLRYLLPAMLDKRDRLVVNRLNPELLKCGY